MKNTMTVGAIILVVALAVGQGLAFLLNSAGYFIFLTTLRVVLSQVAFWGPIIAVIAGGFILITMRLLGFNTLDEIRQESVEQNNPTRGDADRQPLVPHAGHPALISDLTGR
ncbi:MAG: hypothetical protein HW418_3046 [Anaerolineales bacterium]|nr:hypothetical protein [Anaerolineales bacterium]